MLSKFKNKLPTLEGAQEIYINDNLILTANQLYNFVYTMHTPPFMMSIEDDFCFFTLQRYTDNEVHKIIGSHLTLNEIFERLKSVWESILNQLTKEVNIQKHSENLAKLTETVDKTMPELRNIIYIPKPTLDSGKLENKTRMAEDYVNNIETKFMESVDKVVEAYGLIKINIPKQTRAN